MNQDIALSTGLLDKIRGLVKVDRYVERIRVDGRNVFVIGNEALAVVEEDAFGSC